MLRSVQKCKKCSFLDNLRTITQERKMETGQITLFYFIYFLRSNCLYHSFLNLKILKIHFHVVPLWIVLACKTPQFLEKSYQFRQLIILFQNVGTLRLLRIYIMFCPPAVAKCHIFTLKLLDYWTWILAPVTSTLYIKKLIHNQFHIATSWVQANMGYTT